MVRKADPAPDYPPEEGCYLRGNDYSPVAVLVILKWTREETPPEIEELVRVGVESGAALSGTLQTENIGLEKVICNVVANPNIRYLLVCGPESPGHRVGETIVALMQNGIDERKRILGTSAQTPYLFNIPAGFVERFRRQVTVIDLVHEGRPEVIREAVQACYQEEPTPFRGHLLHDVGAYDEPPVSSRITWRVTDPVREPKSEEERAGLERIQALMDRVREAAEARHGGPIDPPLGQTGQEG
jgi:tetrahydromethanopterin S-methyltransferase subunit A